MADLITIRTKVRTFDIPAGKPVIVKWRSKNKQRQGINTAVGWIKPGEKPHTVLLIHSCFQTWDKVEQEYPSSWNIYESQIISVHNLSIAR